MSTARRIAKNTTILFISQIISYILIFFYTIYIARYLGAEGYGTLSFALAFSGIFSILADLGLSTLTVREIARDKSLAKKYLGNALLIKIILAFLTFGLIALFVNLLDYPQETINVVYFISLSTISTSMFGIFYSIFQAYEKMEYQSLGQILSSILMFFGVLIGPYLGFDVIGFSILYFISNVIVLGYSFFICSWKFLIPKIEYDKYFWKTIIKESLPFGLTSVSIMLYTYIDSVLLSIMEGNEVVGWYNAAYKLVLFLVVIPTTINITIFPSMSKFHISSQDSLKLINEKYFKLMIITGIPLGVATTLLSDKIILLIFGAGYTQSIIALQILIWTIVFTFGGASFVRLLEATNKQLILTKITGISVIINIALNLILIPKFSFVGASIATILTEIILVSIVIKINYKLGYGIPTKKILNNLLKISFASLIMGLVIIYLKNLNLLSLSILAILTYSVTLLAVKGIDNKDIKIIRQVFK